VSVRTLVLVTALGFSPEAPASECEPEDVAGGVIYLSSPAADLVTGHTLVIDGGWTAV